MSRKWIVTIFILALTFAGTSNAGSIRKLSPHVTVCEGSVNGSIIEQNGQFLAPGCSITLRRFCHINPWPDCLRLLAGSFISRKQ